MAISFCEKYDSRTITTGSDGAAESAEFAYILRGVADDSSARTLASNSTAVAYGVLARRSITIEPVHIDTTNADACIWDVTVQYGVADEPEAGDEPTFSFDTTGGTQHITQSKQNISKTAASGAAPDFKGAIGVTSNGVEGVDITVPVYAFTYTYYLEPGQVTQSFRMQIFALTGKVNSGSFRGFAAGEVLFLGATGSVRRGEKWEITFRFAASQNRTNIPVGTITVPSKKGWEYLWVKYAEQEDENAKTLVQQPIAAYVERVYDEASFAPLEINV